MSYQRTESAKMTMENAHGTVGAPEIRGRFSRQHCKPLHGFTLIELLVVMAIVALLISLLVPALKQAKFVTDRVTCNAHQRQMLLGMAMYAGDSHGFVTRLDYGRADGNYRLEMTSIHASRALGPTPAPTSSGGDVINADGPSPVHRGIFAHGSWLINAYVSTGDVMYCPGLSFEQPKKPAFGGMATWKEVLRERRTYFQSGGTTGSASGAILLTAYNFNKNIMFPADAKNGAHSAFWKGPVSGDQSLAAWRIDAMDSRFPIFMDARGDTETLYVAYHRSEGFNVARADGSTSWLRAEDIIAAGQRVAGGAISPVFNIYAGQPLPANPLDDGAVLGIPIGKQWFNSAGRHPLDVPFQAIAKINR